MNTEAMFKESVENCDHDLIQSLLEIMDVDTMERFLQCFSGSELYVPQFKSIKRQIRDACISDDFYHKNCSFSQLSLKYNLSNRQIRAIVTLQKNSKSSKQPTSTK